MQLCNTKVVKCLQSMHNTFAFGIPILRSHSYLELEIVTDSFASDDGAQLLTDHEEHDNSLRYQNKVLTFRREYT